jgi:HEAT repeat protein
LEEVTPRQAVLALRDPQRLAPTRIWRVLEHAEKLECLECVPHVAKLLYDGDSRTREISAWWLRRRVFGVFGPSEVYEQVLATLADRQQPEAQRAYAANAVGEFLSVGGVAPLAAALSGDPSALVRRAAALGLERLNSAGPGGALAAALADTDESVRLATLHAATHIHVFTDVAAVVARVSDASMAVRRAAAEALGAFRAADAVLPLMVLARLQNEPEAVVRAAAVWALGQIADAQARDTVQAALQDPDGGVRDAARGSLYRL